MEFNIEFTKNQVVEILRQMPENMRNEVIEEVKKGVSSEIENLILEDFKIYDKTFRALESSKTDTIIDEYHKKYEETYKNLAK